MSLKKLAFCFLVLSSLSGSKLFCPSSLASDWIEDESQQQGQEPQHQPDPRFQQRPPQEQEHQIFDHEPTPRPQQKSQENIEENPVGNVKDTSRPLEAGVSSFKQIENNFDNLPLLLQKPLLAQPKTGPVTPKTYSSWLNQTHPGLTGRISKDQVIEIKGEWDDSSHTLRSFGIPYTRVGPKQINNIDLSKVKVIVLCCPGSIPHESTRTLANYVKAGGYLITTDWAVEILTEDKGFVRIIEPSGFTYDEKVVDALGLSSDPLCQGTPPNAFWKIAKESKAVRIVQRKYATVIARSRQLMNQELRHVAKYRPPEENDFFQAGILAVLIDYGRGKIFHLVGHYDNDANTAFVNDVADPAPGIQISLRQAMATNFIAEAFEK